MKYFVPVQNMADPPHVITLCVEASDSYQAQERALREAFATFGWPSARALEPTELTTDQERGEA